MCQLMSCNNVSVHMPLLNTLTATWYVCPGHTDVTAEPPLVTEKVIALQACRPGAGQAQLLHSPRGCPFSFASVLAVDQPNVGNSFPASRPTFVFIAKPPSPTGTGNSPVGLRTAMASVALLRMLITFGRAVGVRADPQAARGMQGTG
jgi:hypothetical protein